MLKIFTPFAFVLALFGGPSPDSYSRMVDTVSNSVVRITGEKEVEVFGETETLHFVCTGFVIARHRVMTAAHCINEVMQADGIDVKVLKVDEYADLALLEVGTPKPVLGIRDEPLVRFEDLTAIGYGWGWKQLTVLHERAFILGTQVQASRAPGVIVQGGYIGGMSGGPVVDKDGHVVCMVQQSNDGIGYGVPSLSMRAFLYGI